VIFMLILNLKIQKSTMKNYLHSSGNQGIDAAFT